MTSTLSQVIRLFQGYPNYSEKVADDVATKIFNAATTTDIANFIPFTGSATQYLTGSIRTKTGGAYDFYDGANTLMAGLTWNANTLYLLDQQGAQTFTLSFANTNLFGTNIKLGQSAANKIGFFGSAGAVRQVVDATATIDPVGGATIDTEARASIVILNTVVNSMRSILKTSYGLFG